MLEFLRLIEKVADKMAPGRSPSFNEALVVRALETISIHGTVGRIRLSKELELGEGSVRTFLKHASKENLVECSRYGITLTTPGQRLFSNLRTSISQGIEIPNSPLTVGPSNVAVLVKDVAHKVRSGIEQRDIAFKAGASGATTLVFSQNKLGMPLSKHDVFKTISTIRDILMSKLEPKENDVIIIGCGESRRLAEQGAIMAALKLLDEEQQSLGTPE